MRHFGLEKLSNRIENESIVIQNAFIFITKRTEFEPKWIFFAPLIDNNALILSQKRTIPQSKGVLFASI